MQIGAHRSPAPCHVEHIVQITAASERVCVVGIDLDLPELSICAVPVIEIDVGAIGGVPCVEVDYAVGSLLRDSVETSPHAGEGESLEDVVGDADFEREIGAVC